MAGLTVVEAVLERPNLVLELTPHEISHASSKETQRWLSLGAVVEVVADPDVVHADLGTETTEGAIHVGRRRLYLSRLARDAGDGPTGCNAHGGHVGHPARRAPDAVPDASVVNQGRKE